MDNMQLFVILGGFVTSLFGLVAWLLKYSAKKEDVVTQRYFKHLEEKDAQNTKIIESFTTAIHEVAEAVKTLARTLKTEPEKK